MNIEFGFFFLNSIIWFFVFESTNIFNKTYEKKIRAFILCPIYLSSSSILYVKLHSSVNEMGFILRASNYQDTDNQANVEMKRDIICVYVAMKIVIQPIMTWCLGMYLKHKRMKVENRWLEIAKALERKGYLDE